ncbi:hypothetical protein Hdeb2414_s0012g00393271 [Helianthus debilis subsp. tardiflorus]
MFGSVTVNSVFGSESVKHESTRSTRSNRVNSADSSTQSTFDTHEMEYCRMHVSKSSLGNDITKSYIASFAQEYSGEFITPPFTVLHFSKCFRGGKPCTFCKAYKNSIFLNHFTSKFN